MQLDKVVLGAAVGGAVFFAGSKMIPAGAGFGAMGYLILGVGAGGITAYLVGQGDGLLGFVGVCAAFYLKNSVDSSVSLSQNAAQNSNFQQTDGVCRSQFPPPYSKDVSSPNYGVYQKYVSCFQQKASALGLDQSWVNSNMFVPGV